MVTLTVKSLQSKLWCAALDAHLLPSACEVKARPPTERNSVGKSQQAASEALKHHTRSVKRMKTRAGGVIMKCKEVKTT